MSEGYQKLKNLPAKHFIQHIFTFSYKPESLHNITSVKRFSRPGKLFFFFLFFLVRQLK